MQPAAGLDDRFVVFLPEQPGAPWAWWRTNEAAHGTWQSGEPLPWDEGAAVTALVPAALAPVRIRPLPDIPAAQAIAAERLTASGLGSDCHVAASAAGAELLSARVARADMDRWLAECAAAGFEPDAMVPAALVLPGASGAPVMGVLAGQPLARTSDAAFAAEPDLLGALAPGAGDLDDVAELLPALVAAPPLDLRQGIYAPRRVSIFLLPDWRRLARMAAVAALLALVLMVVTILRLNHAASAAEEAALASARSRFPAATDLAAADRLVSAELARRGDGAASFGSTASAVLAAIRAEPALSMSELAWTGAGLRATFAAATSAQIEAVRAALIREGWEATVVQPVAGGAATLTVRAP